MLSAPKFEFFTVGREGVSRRGSIAGSREGSGTTVAHVVFTSHPIVIYLFPSFAHDFLFFSPLSPHFLGPKSWTEIKVWS
jgi:hypothetical protein